MMVKSQRWLKLTFSCLHVRCAFILQLRSLLHPPASDFKWVFLCPVCTWIKWSELGREVGIEEQLFFPIFCCSLKLWTIMLQNLCSALPMSFHRLFWLRNENKWRCRPAAATLNTASSIPIWKKSIRHHSERLHRSCSTITAVDPQIGLRFLNAFKSDNLTPNSRAWLIYKGRLKQRNLSLNVFSCQTASYSTDKLPLKGLDT